MTSTIYPAGTNPAVSLYNLWHTLLSGQGVIDLKDDSAFRQRHWDTARTYPRAAYGARRMGIGVYGFDAQRRPIIEYGCWYGSGLHPYMCIDADGNFMLLNCHGDAHRAIEGHTFLAYGWRGGKYVFAVVPTHAPGKSIDTYDWRTGRPWLHQRVIEQHYWNKRPWLMLQPHPTGWEMVAHPTLSEPLLQSNVRLNQERALRAYRRAQRKELGRLPNLSVRDGKTTLNNNDAVLRIAAVLDVSQPAKARPLIRRAEEAQV